MHNLQQGQANGFMHGAGSTVRHDRLHDVRKVFAKDYDKEPEVYGCDGCAGQHDSHVCFNLPLGCAAEGIIWVSRKLTPLQQYHAALEQDIG